MKKILFLLILALLSSCSEPTERIEKKLLPYLQEDLKFMVAQTIHASGNKDAEKPEQPELPWIYRSTAKYQERMSKKYGTRTGNELLPIGESIAVTVEGKDRSGRRQTAVFAPFHGDGNAAIRQHCLGSAAVGRPRHHVEPAAIHPITISIVL